MDKCDHSWRFDGDDPYVVCGNCRERRDALTGRPISSDPSTLTYCIEIEFMPGTNVEEAARLVEWWGDEAFKSSYVLTVKMGEVPQA
jgi:hypothetical protein